MPLQIEDNDENYYKINVCTFLTNNNNKKKMHLFVCLPWLVECLPAYVHP